jgi:short subunit dehydrogenase-like uncharacterized protein
MKTKKTATPKVKTPATAKAKTAAKAKATKPAAKKLSQIDAAVQVLAKAKEPMNCQAMVDAMATAGLWSSPGGKTPAATLYASILRELATKGKDARFVKKDRGLFALVARK